MPWHRCVLACAVVMWWTSVASIAGVEILLNSCASTGIWWVLQNQMAVEVLEQLRSISGQQSKIRRMREKLALFRQVRLMVCRLSLLLHQAWSRSQELKLAAGSACNALMLHIPDRHLGFSRAYQM